MKKVVNTRYNDDQERSKKKIVFIAAVVVTTIIIVVFWLLLLPFQLQKFSLLSEIDRVQWDTIREEIKKQNADLSKAIGLAQNSFTSIEQLLGFNPKDKLIEKDAKLLSQEITKRLQTKLQEKENNNSDEITVGESEIQPN
jgi:hypothetical protein